MTVLVLYFPSLVCAGPLSGIYDSFWRVWCGVYIFSECLPLSVRHFLHIFNATDKQVWLIVIMCVHHTSTHTHTHWFVSFSPDNLLWYLVIVSMIYVSPFALVILSLWMHILYLLNIMLLLDIKVEVVMDLFVLKVNIVIVIYGI